MSDGGVDIDPNNGFLDPRIQEELERLNTASAEINNLEIQLDESRQNFRQTLTESTHQLGAKLKKCRKSAARAQSYYIAREEARQAQESAQEAALKYQRASSMFLAAKETISIAEEAAITNQNRAEKKRQFDSALQEMLNLSTMKLNAAEQDKRESQQEHEDRSQHYIATQQRVDQLAKKYKRSISNSASYYELKKTFFHEMNDLKTRTEGLQKALHDSKSKYHRALKNLEQISEDIHHSRQVAAILAGSRQSGVGADSNSNELDPEHLDNPFEMDDKFDNVSVNTDDVSIDSAPTSPRSTSPSKASNFTSRSISGSSMPSRENDEDNETDGGLWMTRERSSVEGASGRTSSRSDNDNPLTDDGRISTSATLKKYDVNNEDAENDVDDDEDADDDDGEDIVFDVDSDDDSDDDDDNGGSSQREIRKLRTISLGELTSVLGVIEFDNDDDKGDEGSKNTSCDDQEVKVEAVTSAGVNDEGVASASLKANDAEINSEKDSENNPHGESAATAADSKPSDAQVDSHPDDENNRRVDDNDDDDDDAEDNANRDDIATSSSKEAAPNSEQETSREKADDGVVWI